jgi:hypothetical protein
MQAAAAMRASELVKAMALRFLLRTDMRRNLLGREFAGWDTPDAQHLTPLM